MQESSMTDNFDNLTYPDPLSLNFTKIQLTELPKLRELSAPDLQRFWLFIQKFYSSDAAEGDDIILTLNNIPYLGILKPGDNIYLPALTDIYSMGGNQLK